MHHQIHQFANLECFVQISQVIAHIYHLVKFLLLNLQRTIENINEIPYLIKTLSLETTFAPQGVNQAYLQEQERPFHPEGFCASYILA